MEFDVESEDFQVFREMLLLAKKCTQIHLRDIGLSVGQPAILYVIKQCSDLNQKEIARKCQIKPSTLSKSLDVMERNGFIRRHINTDKRRTIYLRLTPLGEEKLSAAMKCHEKVFNTFFENISEEEQELVKSVFLKIHKNLARYYEEVKVK